MNRTILKRKHECLCPAFVTQCTGYGARDCPFVGAKKRIDAERVALAGMPPTGDSVPLGPLCGETRSDDEEQGSWEPHTPEHSPTSPGVQGEYESHAYSPTSPVPDLLTCETDISVPNSPSYCPDSWRNIETTTYCIFCDKEKKIEEYCTCDGAIDAMRNWMPTIKKIDSLADACAAAERCEQCDELTDDLCYNCVDTVRTPPLPSDEEDWVPKHL